MASTNPFDLAPSTSARTVHVVLPGSSSTRGEERTRQLATPELEMTPMTRPPCHRRSSSAWAWIPRRGRTLR